MGEEKVVANVAQARAQRGRHIPRPGFDVIEEVRFGTQFGKKKFVGFPKTGWEVHHCMFFLDGWPGRSKCSRKVLG